jgi:signal transduction histidine kinase/CheY-like chemotaxis protein
MVVSFQQAVDAAIQKYSAEVWDFMEPALKTSEIYRQMRLLDMNATSPDNALRQQSAMARFGELALRSDDLDEVLTEACLLVSEALGTDLAKVMELQHDGETLLVRAGIGWNAGVIGQTRVLVKDDTSESFALKTGLPVICIDIDTEARFKFPPFLIDHGVKSVANVVIIGANENEPFGLLQIDSRQRRTFGEGDTAFLRGYANVLAAAVARIRASEEARDENERLRLALTTSELGSWEIDLSNGAMVCSPRCDEIFGYPDRLSCWTRETLLSHIAADDLKHVVSAFWHTEHQGTDLHCAFRIERAGDGDPRWIELRGRLVGGFSNIGSGHLLGVVADLTTRKATEDNMRLACALLEEKMAARTTALVEANATLRAQVTQRQLVEETLRQSQKMEAVGQLTGGIAHDFNNMLQAIGGSLELMDRRLEQGRYEEMARLMDDARKTVARAASLTDRLLRFAHQSELQPSEIDPQRLIHDLAELIQRTVGPAVIVEEQQAGSNWTVICDPHQLESTILNLTINARDAMPAGGKLTLGTRNVHLTVADVSGEDDVEPGPYVEIYVTDTGIGMDEATKAHVFEPFFTTKPVGKGTGLGLSQLYGFVRQSRGMVQIDSVLSQGTTVRLHLPGRESGASDIGSGPTTEAQSEAPPEKPVVLLIEDEVSLRIAIADALRELQYNVLEVADGPAALALLNDTSVSRVDLMMTEVDLPGSLDGRQVANAASVIRSGLSVLFITADTGARLEGNLPVGAGLIGKPFTLNSLAAKLGSMINHMGGTRLSFQQ